MMGQFGTTYKSMTYGVLGHARGLTILVSRHNLSLIRNNNPLLHFILNIGWHTTYLTGLIVCVFGGGVPQAQYW